MKPQFLLPLEKLFICFYYITQNNLNIRICSSDIKKIIFFFKYHTNLLYNQLIDISMIDYLEKKYRFEIFYNLRSIKYNSRLFLTSALSENTILSSITSLYPNSN
jgi:NADH-quinone oxidoreductase subunit C